MKWWGWLLIGVLTLVIVGFVVNLIKATFWLVVVAALLVVIGWLVSFIVKFATSIWPG